LGQDGSSKGSKRTLLGYSGGSPAHSVLILPLANMQFLKELHVYTKPSVLVVERYVQVRV